MHFPGRRWWFLGFALVALTLIGLWAMRPNEAERATSIPQASTADAARVPAELVAETSVSEPLEARRSVEVEGGSEVLVPPSHAPVLRGRVFDEDSGAPISDAQIIVVRGNGRPSATSAGDGTFAITGLNPGPLSVFVNAGEYYVTGQLDVVLGDDTGPVEIGLYAGASISGRVVTADGIAPAAGVTKLWDLARGSGLGGSTGPAGEFNFQQLLPGRYQLRAYAVEGIVTRQIEVAKGERIVGIILTLTAGHSIRGVITGLRPELLSRVTISTAREGEAGGIEAAVSASGAYVIQGVTPGRVSVMADASERQMSKTVDMPTDSDLTLNFDFPRGARLSGRITRGGEPMSGVPIGPGLPPGVQTSLYINGTTTAEDGTYVIEDLPPGDYVLEIFPFARPRLKISGDTVYDFEVPAGELSGRVFESRGGEPIPGAEVYFWPAEPAEGHRPMPTGSNESGRFTLIGLEPGEFMLTVYKPGYEMVRKRISYGADSADLKFALREERGVEVSAREAESGTPLRQLIAVEVIGNGRGTLVRLQLDEGGVGYLPAALTGSTLKFIDGRGGLEPVVIDHWSGDKLDLQLEPTRPR